MKKVIGIDLGTTNSCVAIFKGDAPIVITNKEGNSSMPSVVSFNSDGSYIVGAMAKRQASVFPHRTSFSIKRKMGSEYRLRIDGYDHTPQEISALILMKIKEDAQNFIGEEITDAVITVPAYFSDAQRQATKDAGRIAGLNVLRIINEPTAAALAYGLDNEEPQKILVYDLGGGTFDVSIIEIVDGVLEVLATSGDNYLGGDDFDERICDKIIEEIKKQKGINLRKDEFAIRRIKEEAERVKKELSTSTVSNINLPFLTKIKNEVISFEMALTREEFNHLTKDLIEKTIIPIENALKDANISKSEISKILLVGGSTKMPAIYEMLEKVMGRLPSRDLNPDECVAIGAAIQGGKLGGMIDEKLKASEMILMDVTPLTLSIETVGGIASQIIKRNTTIPTRHSQIFTTALNSQTSVDIRVFQGERKFTKDNKLIGNFKLSGIKKLPAGVPQIEVTFDIDVNGIVKVSAKDFTTGNEQSIRITSSQNLSEDEIETAIWKAKCHEAEDGPKLSLADEKRKAQMIIKKARTFLEVECPCLEKEVKKVIKEEIGRIKRQLLISRFTKKSEECANKIREYERTLKALIKSCENKKNTKR